MKRLSIFISILAVLALGALTGLKLGWLDKSAFRQLLPVANAIVRPDDQPDTQRAQPTAPKNANTEKSNSEKAAPDANRAAAASNPQQPADASRASTAAGAPAVSVARVTQAQFVDDLFVTGSLRAREDVLLSPEIEGVRVIAIHAEEGDTVKKGDLLAEFQDAKIQAELDQNAASLKRVAAEKRQVESQLAEAEAVLIEARKALARAKPLETSGYLSESTLDQRQTALRSAEARVASAKDGLLLADARRAELEATRREITWRLSRTRLKAPVAGRISKRNVRIGQLASAAASPMFQIIENGEIELVAEVDDTRISRLEPGQTANVTTASGLQRSGTVRLVSPTVDETTRLGLARLALGRDDRLPVGSFARARVTLRTSQGLAVPASAVLYAPSGPTVQKVIDDRIVTTRVTTGLSSNGLIEIRDGLNRGDVVVTKAGTFLREGDQVRPVFPASRLSEATR